MFILLLLFTEEAVRIKGQTVGTVSTEECVPPAHVFASEENQTLLEPLFPPNAETKVSLKLRLFFFFFFFSIKNYHFL